MACLEHVVTYNHRNVDARGNWKGVGRSLCQASCVIDRAVETIVDGKGQNVGELWVPTPGDEVQKVGS